MIDRITNTFVTFVFAAMAVLQLNDPDPLYWILVYAAVAWVAAVAGTRLETRSVVLVSIGMVCAGLVIAAPGFVDYLRSGDPLSLVNRMGEQPYVEPAREFLGLALGLAALLHYRRREAGTAAAPSRMTGTH